MVDKRKVIVGYDLGDEYSQICCYSYKTFEPIPISNTDIPTVLSINNESGNWLFGEEALDYVADKKGELLDHILMKITSEETATIGGEEFSGVQLLEKFFRKTLAEVKRHFPSELITKIVVTVKEKTPILTSGIYQALSMLGIEKDRSMVINHSSAYMYYALSQEGSLWINDVGIFNYDKDGLSYYQISINKRNNPKIAGINKKDFKDVLGYSMLNKKDIDLSYILENVANQVLYKQIISTLYFIGEGFEGDWAKDVLKKLSVGRRAFIVTDICSKGACYRAKELYGDGKLEEYVILDDEMIADSAWIDVYTDAKIKEVMLVEAGTPWHEVDNTIEVIVDDESEINIVFRNIITKEIKKESFILSNIPERPNRVTRLGINISYVDKHLAKIKVEDLGFGEFYPPSNRIWEFNIVQDASSLES